MATKPTFIRLSAPSSWASYLINGDASGMDLADKSAADAWIARVGLGGPVDCEDDGFHWQHDAMKECPLGADCQGYSFRLNEAKEANP